MDSLIKSGLTPSLISQAHRFILTKPDLFLFPIFRAQSFDSAKLFDVMGDQRQVIRRHNKGSFYTPPLPSDAMRPGAKSMKY
jgi:hypothetical protein